MRQCCWEYGKNKSDPIQIQAVCLFHKKPKHPHLHLHAVDVKFRDNVARPNVICFDDVISDLKSQAMSNCMKCGERTKNYSSPLDDAPSGVWLDRSS